MGIRYLIARSFPALTLILFVGLWSFEADAAALIDGQALSPPVSPALEKYTAWRDAVLSGTTPAADRDIESLRRKRARAEHQTNAFARNVAERAVADRFLRTTAPLTDARMDGLLKTLGLSLSADEKTAFRDAVWQLIHQTDRDNTAWLKMQLAERKEWFRISEIGPEAASDAWLLVQHADLAPDFQEEALRMMAPLVASNDIRKEDYALLWDRVAVKKREPQRFGTQMHCENGEFEPFPLEDPGHLDSLRASAGLEPFSQYAAHFDNAMCR
jgi:hypothetical protein